MQIKKKDRSHIEKVLLALAHEDRLEIYRYLSLGMQGGTLSIWKRPLDIERKLSLSQYNIAKHLNRLTDA